MSRRSAKFQQTSLYLDLSCLYKWAGLQGTTSHSGRRSVIANLAARGANPRALQQLASPQSLNTTLRYIDVNDSVLRAVVELVVRADVIEVRDVGVVQRGYGAGFASEALRELGVADFDRDITTEALVVGSIDFAHAAIAEQAEDFVGTELVACGERHMNDRDKFTRSECG